MREKRADVRMNSRWGKGMNVEKDKERTEIKDQYFRFRFTRASAAHSAINCYSHLWSCDEQRWIERCRNNQCKRGRQKGIILFRCDGIPYRKLARMRYQKPLTLLGIVIYNFQRDAKLDLVAAQLKTCTKESDEMYLQLKKVNILLKQHFLCLLLSINTTSCLFQNGVEVPNIRPATPPTPSTPKVFNPIPKKFSPYPITSSASLPSSSQPLALLPPPSSAPSTPSRPSPLNGGRSLSMSSPIGIRPVPASMLGQPGPSNVIVRPQMPIQQPQRVVGQRGRPRGSGGSAYQRKLSQQIGPQVVQQNNENMARIERQIQYEQQKQQMEQQKMQQLQHLRQLQLQQQQQQTYTVPQPSPMGLMNGGTSLNGEHTFRIALHCDGISDSRYWYYHLRFSHCSESSLLRRTRSHLSFLSSRFISATAAAATTTADAAIAAGFQCAAQIERGRCRCHYGQGKQRSIVFCISLFRMCNLLEIKTLLCERCIQNWSLQAQLETSMSNSSGLSTPLPSVTPSNGLLTSNQDGLVYFDPQAIQQLLQQAGLWSLLIPIQFFLAEYYTGAAATTAVASTAAAAAVGSAFCRAASTCSICSSIDDVQHDRQLRYASHFHGESQSYPSRNDSRPNQILTRFCLDISPILNCT